MEPGFEKGLQSKAQIFEQIFGIKPPTNVTKESAANAALQLVEMEEKKRLGVSPIGIEQIARIYAGQIFGWLNSQTRSQNLGYTHSITDNKTLRSISKSFAGGGLSSDEIKKLIAQKMVADPQFGVDEAMRIHDLLMK